MTESTSLTPEPQAPATAGQWLREARTRQGVHLAVLSAALKVPVRSLEHLEADRHEELPGATFVRALAQSVCRQLRLDPAPVLALLPDREVSAGALPASLQTSIPAAGRSRSLRLDGHQLAYVALASTMLIVIAGLLWWPATPVSRVVTPVSSAVSSDANALPGAPAQTVVASGGTDPRALHAAAGPLPPSGTVSSEPNATTASSTAMPSVAPAAPLAGTMNPPHQASGAAPTLRLVANGECWVEVRDAANQVVLSLLMQAGQRQDVVQPAPLRVVLGQAAVMQVQVRGQAFDLAPHTKVTVARFEVQP